MMASLKFIMDVNVDEHQPDRQPAHNNKKDQGPGKPTTTGHLQEARTNPLPRPRHASSPGLATEQDINPPLPPLKKTKRRGGGSSRLSKSLASSTKTASADTETAPRINTGNTDRASPLAPARSRRISARSTSTTSTESMDRSPAYGSPASSSSSRRRGSMRPMRHHPLNPEVPVRFTPITGRPSIARKGLPVHVCNICEPPKTFTRAEHLRRHQLSHGKPQFQCAACDKAFHRQDLLTRHQQKSGHGGEIESKLDPHSDREQPGAVLPPETSNPMPPVSPEPYPLPTPEPISPWPPYRYDDILYQIGYGQPPQYTCGGSHVQGQLIPPNQYQHQNPIPNPTTPPNPAPPAIVPIAGSQAVYRELTVFHGMGTRYGGSSGDASPGGDSGSYPRIVEELDLHVAAGCPAPMPVPGPLAIPLPSSVTDAIPRYLEMYWSRIHPTMPIVHRKSYEARAEGVLTCAMAAVATQCLEDKEDRTRGSHLHDYAWQEVKRIAKWDLQTKQAILLCEYFARFRGRKAITSPSKMFRSLYERGLQPGVLGHAVTNANDPGISLETRWLKWVEAESCRRLLAACFLCDGHTSIYQQLPRAMDYESDSSPMVQWIPLFGGSDLLWEASSAEEWGSILNSDPEIAETQYVPDVEHLTTESVRSRTAVDQMLILARCALRLPRRPSSRTTSASENNTPAPETGSHPQHLSVQFGASQQGHLQSFSAQAHDQRSVEAENRIISLFGDSPAAYTYLALHHTPLRDLLAVSGDSWLYSQKVLPANLFQDHQKRLRLWVIGKLAGYNQIKATVYASRAISLFLNRRPWFQGCNSENAPWSSDISDYWGLYVCALICWAFSYHRGQSRQRSGSGESSPTASGNGQFLASTDEDVMNWLRTVGAQGMSHDEVLRLRGRREAAGVVGLVRRRLQRDCVGGRNRLYVDAVGVLERLDREREGPMRKLF